MLAQGCNYFKLSSSVQWFPKYSKGWVHSKWPNHKLVRVSMRQERRKLYSNPLSVRNLWELTNHSSSSGISPPAIALTCRYIFDAAGAPACTAPRPWTELTEKQCSYPLHLCFRPAMRCQMSAVKKVYMGKGKEMVEIEDL